MKSTEHAEGARGGQTGLRADPVVISILVLQTDLATSIIWNSPEDLVISVPLPNLPEFNLNSKNTVLLNKHHETKTRP